MAKATTLARLLLAAALALSSADAQSCSALTQNTLTSAGCPSTCASAYPCVLYAPSLADTKPCTKLSDAAGPCLTQADFTVSGSTSACNVTYQCMEAIMNGQQWLLAVDNIANANTVSMAYVTEIKSVKYDASKTLSVQVVGGATVTTRKGVMKEVAVDQSFFDTPNITTSMFLLHLNLRNALKTLTISSKIQTLSLINVNLAEVPEQLSSLDLGKL
ncbi:hypothetical protein Gpo141_00014404 [Globisporangium polare]